MVFTTSGFSVARYSKFEKILPQEHLGIGLYVGNKKVPSAVPDII